MTERLKAIGSSVAKLRALLSDARKDLQRIEQLQNTLTESLDNLWDEIVPLTRDQNVWKETLSLVASGRVLGVAAQAEETLASNTNTTRSKSWISDGGSYARWLGRGVTSLVKSSNVSDTTSLRAAAALLGKSFSLGNTDVIVEQVLDALVLEKASSMSRIHILLEVLSRYEQKQLMVSTISIVSRRYLYGRSAEKDINTSSRVDREADKAIGGSAALFRNITTSKTSIENEMCVWLTSNPCSNYLARALLAALTLESRRSVLDKSWEQFGDNLRIKHTPILQQESSAQVLLMAAGYIYRSDPKYVFNKARSGVHTSGVSAHLGSSSLRVRFLGMIVGMAISQLVDPPDTRMKFDDKDINCDEGVWYSKLVEVDDKIGKLVDLGAWKPEQTLMPHVGKKKSIPTKNAKPVKPMILEVLDNNDDEDEFPTYQKPDSDAEDDEEDPTLVQRNKPKAPVYIRDLITGLKDTEHFDNHSLALTSAAPLIRRKADFGAELKDRIEELALTLVGLGDPFGLDNWHDMRQQAMVATIVAQPRRIGPWYARAFFNGDYSISQRASILVSLGLAARELAGFQREMQPPPDLASKRLPDRLHKLYAQTSEVDVLSRQLEQTMLRPVSTKNQRRKIIRNDLAGMVAESFFFPLTGYWHSFTQSSHTRSVFVDPFLLPLFLKTIAIITSASGSSTLVLPQMTSEFWQLLLSLRTQALNDSAILEAELFSFLTILNVNEDRRRLATECSTELLETQEWVGMVFEKLSDADEESGRCKVLAAGVLVAIKDVVEHYHRLMVGDMIRM